MPDLPARRIACFISPHGFGHASRASAIMEALHKIDPSFHFELFTKVPRWFFRQSLTGPFTYHALLTDVGMAQASPLHEDLPKTLQLLNEFLPFEQTQIARLAERIARLKCELVLCDIAPMGIAVSKKAGIASVLVENFTWDWIYWGYTRYDSRIKRHATYLRKLFDDCDYRIQTEPICQPLDADLTTQPVSRKVRMPKKQLRRRLGISDRSRMVVLTMGGAQQPYKFPTTLLNQRKVTFVIPGSSRSVKRQDNVVLLPYHSDFFHPDLINAADVVIGKLGVSTIAEAHHSATPFGFVKRPRFRESKVLAAYVERHMHARAITEAQFQNGRWVSRLSDLLSVQRRRRKGPNGAVQAAKFIHRLLG